MPVRMRIRNACRMRVLVVLIMDMLVIVFQGFVVMHVLMVLRQMQQKSRRHQNACNQEVECQWFAHRQSHLCLACLCQTNAVAEQQSGKR